MKKISVYTVDSYDVQSLSKIACNSLMRCRCREPWVYEFTLAFKGDVITVQFGMQGIAFDSSYNLAPVNNATERDMEAWDFLASLQNKVQYCGESMNCITFKAKLDLVEKAPNMKFGVKAFDVHLFEK